MEEVGDSQDLNASGENNMAPINRHSMKSSIGTKDGQDLSRHINENTPTIKDQLSDHKHSINSLHDSNEKRQNTAHNKHNVPEIKGLPKTLGPHQVITQNHDHIHNDERFNMIDQRMKQRKQQPSDTIGSGTTMEAFSSHEKSDKVSTP